MSVVETVRDRDELFVPSVMSRLVATDQEDGDAPRVERVEDPIGAPVVLDPKLSHVAMARGLNPGAVRVPEIRSQNGGRLSLG